MAGEADRLEEQLRRIVDGPAWHGPAVTELLAGLSAKQVARHPISGEHSIWELVLHLTSDYELVLRRLGGDTHSLTAAEDWPPSPEATDENWDRAVLRLRDLNEELRRAVHDFPAERLHDPLEYGADQSAYTQFIGITQHHAYHAGQIAMLKHAVGA